MLTIPGKVEGQAEKKYLLDSKCFPLREIDKFHINLIELDSLKGFSSVGNPIFTKELFSEALVNHFENNDIAFNFPELSRFKVSHNYLMSLVEVFTVPESG